YSPDFVDFVKQCLVKEREQRPSVAELLTVGLSGVWHTQHPFIVDAVRTITQNGVSAVLANIVGANSTPTPTPTIGCNLFPLTTVINAGSTSSSGTHGSSGKGVLLIRGENDYYSVQKGIHTILTEANVCNNGSITSWSFTSYPQLRELSVGPQSFRCVGSLRLDGMVQLESVVIGEGSFTMCSAIPATSTNNAFVISNCPKLKTIAIASNAFMDWGEFQLKNVKSLRELSVGDNCFCRCRLTVFEDLPSLSSIELGMGVFEGTEQNRNVFRMKNLVKLQSFTAGKCSLGNANEVLFENVPSLQQLELPFAMVKITTCSVKNASLLEEYPTVKEFLDNAKKIQSKEEEKIQEALRVAKEERIRRSEGRVISREDYKNLLESIPGLLIESCCNESDFTSLDLSPFHGLGSISISPQSCRYVTSFAINGMKKLESVVIGEGSFTMCTTTSTNDAFVITNCPKLKTITIASNAFMDWGEFQLKNVKSLRELSMGDNCFCRCRLTVFEDLPSLTSIELGMGVFEGDEQNQNTLTMKNLSKLQSFTAGNKAIRCVTHATLISSTPSLLSHPDIPSLESLCLPRAFEKIAALTFSSTRLSTQSLPDASELERLQNLQPCVTRRFTVRSLQEFNALPADTVEITVENNSCNEPVVGTVDVSRFPRLELLRVGDNCFWNGTALRVVGLSALKTLEVGVNCFNGNGRDSALVLRDCAALQTVDLGYCSFCNYVTCEMSGLPKLESLNIGQVEKESFDFQKASLVVEDMPSLKSLQLGAYCFMRSCHTVIANLPALEECRMGRHALEGNDTDRSSSVEMRGCGEKAN
ncbi:hypothetical protein BLSTO_04939, partial [Blastocystis sp. subtype 1]